MYEAYIETNADNWQGIAYYTKDSAVTHKEFREAVDCLSAAIYDAMQKENLRVGALLNCYEETPVCLLAINKIGGVIKYIDYSKEISDVVDNIIESRFDMLIIDEAFIEIEKRSNTRSAPVIVVRGTRNYDTGHYISYETMITKGASCNNHMTGYKPNKPALIISSSGTTGAPKSIVHSNETVLAAVDKILYTDLMIKRHNLMINAIPPFIGLGIVTTIYTSLIAGMSLIFIQGIAMQEFPIGTSRFISMFADFKRKFNISDEIKLNLFAAPIFFRIIAENDEIKDLSFLGGMLSAGSKMEREDLETLHLIYSKKGCDLPICNGYGQNEMCGAITLNSVSHNSNGSGGFPTIGTEIMIIDPETNNICKVGNIGKIIERSKSSFMYYENMPEETENAYIVLNDGSKWFDTKDLGYIDENGFLYITGRISRVIVRQDFKISAEVIEKKICMHKKVKECAVISNTVGNDEEPIAFITVNQKCNISAVMQEIQYGANPLSDLEMPSKVIEVKEMPYLSSGKIDYITLKKMM